MKCLLLFLSLAACAAPLPAQPAQLRSFDELVAALTAGESVRAVIRYGKCLLVSDRDTLESPDATGGMELTAWELFAKEAVRNPLAFISASATVLIGGKKDHVYNYAKLKLYQDGRAEITARYLEPPTLKVKMDETFYTTINAGADSGAVYLYRAR
jgi:hypothetical protein